MKIIKTVKLAEPVEYGDVAVTALEFRKLRAKHLRRFSVAELENPSLDALLDLAANLSAQPPELIDLLGGADALSVINVVSDFLLNLAPASTSNQPSQS
ncbi:hypothetical protein C4J81_15350 [Deltaproteobacteria bacterium Smac51]|nr:hypothetical protein C4J81_10085 [Deltaproteobacteria bacterium Smac51]UQZ90507.1 hypothetical protein C4J81_15350 [Deltaproteobacteria bacterium Smac51]